MQLADFIFKVLFFSVLLVKFSVEDGKSHWLSGVVLIGRFPSQPLVCSILISISAVYILIAISFWNFPETTRMLQGQALTCS